MKRRVKICVLVLCAVLMAGFVSCSKKELAEEKPVQAAEQVKTGNKVYFAAPLFNQSEKDYNLKITNILESYGYEVIDLGKDVPIETVVEADNKYHPFAIGLSALMTTTVINMEDTIKALRKNNTKAHILVGGAVLTEDIAKSINADYYTKDALGLVTCLDNLLKEGK